MVATPATLALLKQSRTSLFQRQIRWRWEQLALRTSSGDSDASLLVFKSAAPADLLLFPNAPQRKEGRSTQNDWRTRLRHRFSAPVT